MDDGSEVCYVVSAAGIIEVPKSGLGSRRPECKDS